MQRRAHIGLLSLVLFAIAPCAKQGLSPDLANERLPDIAAGPSETLHHAETRATTRARADLALQGDHNADRVALQRFERRARSLSINERQALVRTIEETCARYHVAPALVIAVIEVESAYDPHIVSPVGAVGLMQVMLPTGMEMAGRLDIPWRGPQTLFDPETNIKIGTAYLRQLIDRYGSVRTALVAYNWGPGRIDRRIRRGSTLPALYADQVTRAYSRATGGSVGS